MNKIPSVGVVILNWNTKKMTLRSAEYVLKSDYDNFELAIVDNGSIDGSLIYLKQQLGQKVNFIANKKNLGYSAGFNKGLKYFIDREFDYVMVLNSDAFISSDTITALVKVMKSEMNAGFVSGKVFSFYQPKKLLSVGLEKSWLTLIGKIIGANEIDTGQYEKIKKYDFIDDVFMLIHSKVLDDIGYYDEDFFIQFEEADLISRGKKKGYEAYYTPNAKAWHGISVSTGGTNSPLRYYYSFRNRIIFLRKNQDSIKFLIFLLWYLLYFSPKTILLFLSRKETSVSKSILLGILSGLKYLIKD